MEVYQGLSTMVLRLDNEIINLKLWKCFSSGERGSCITTYSLINDYTLNTEDIDKEYLKFISYLKIDTTDKFWQTRCGQVISEEERINDYGDYYSVYKFHYLTQTTQGDILHITPFDPIDFYLKE